MDSASGLENTSGHGKMSVVPPEVKGGWNWGAFLLNWIWGIGNKTWIALLCFVPFVGFVMVFVLGAMVNEWAWQNKHWNSIQDFRRVQRLWMLWGIGLLVAAIVFGVLMAVIGTMIAVGLSSKK